MKAITLASALAFACLALPTVASAKSVTARVGNKCHPKNAKLVVPKGKVATAFKLKQLQNGVKCGVAGKPDQKGWGIAQGARKIYYWSQWKNKKPSVIGGPLNKLKLGPGTYDVFVDGGRGARASVSFAIR